MRILFLTPRFPYPLLKGDTSRVYHQLRVLGDHHEITLLSLAETPVSSEDYDQVARLCARAIAVPLVRPQVARNLARGVFSRLPLQVHYYHSPALRRQLQTLLAEGAFDLLHVTLVRMLPYVWQRARPPIVVDLIDSLALNLAVRRTQVGGPKRLAYEMEYRRVQAYEQAVVRRFPQLLVTGAADKAALGGGAGIHVLPMGVDLERFPFHGPEGRAPATLIFTGNMGYHPNDEAVLWFAAEVWPRLRVTHPQAVWQIVGTTPSERVRALAAPGSGIEVLGRVPDVVPYLGAATVAVCPLQSGSGIQMKVQEALACGLAVVATPIANRGVQAVDERDLLVAEGGAAVAAACARLLDDAALRARLGTAGRAFVEDHFRWEGHGQALDAIYQTAVGAR